MKYIGNVVALSMTGKRVVVAENVPVEASSDAEARKRLFDERWDPELTTKAECVAVVEVRPEDARVRV